MFLKVDRIEEMKVDIKKKKKKHNQTILLLMKNELRGDGRRIPNNYFSNSNPKKVRSIYISTLDPSPF